MEDIRNRKNNEGLLSEEDTCNLAFMDFLGENDIDINKEDEHVLLVAFAAFSYAWNGGCKK